MRGITALISLSGILALASSPVSAQQLAKYMVEHGYTTTVAYNALQFTDGTTPPVVGPSIIGAFSPTETKPSLRYEFNYPPSTALQAHLATVQAFCQAKKIGICTEVDLQDAIHVAWPPGTKSPTEAKTFYEAVIVAGVTEMIEPANACPPAPKCPACPSTPPAPKVEPLCIPPDVLISAANAAYERRVLPSEAQKKLRAVMPWLSAHLCPEGGPRK